MWNPQTVRCGWTDALTEAKEDGRSYGVRGTRFHKESLRMEEKIERTLLSVELTQHYGARRSEYGLHDTRVVGKMTKSSLSDENGWMALSRIGTLEPTVPDIKRKAFPWTRDEE
ncbi:hypothetical protein CIHG_07062 [Coccidioides immitis H538.4]|nr:hypothetical protein CIRG_08574 [Coccidioides immitis RMSCC 2394]KMU74049.1 hypothetical protein CISG_03978 [Coccidioides immitis RMSCC 3703]KMU89130.1 hypothetical protein CIHG_07062 [Coccidioides immitis H538.4]